MSTEAVEDYLQAIYEIESEHQRVSTTALADWMRVKPASATAMLKKLSAMGWVTYAPYQGAVLSTAGRVHALEITRHHQLLELFLVEVLGVPWEHVYEEAHRLEHALSEYLEARIDEVLGHPLTCPHGAPIPMLDGTVAARSWMRLSDLRTGQAATVSRVSDYDADLLRYLDMLHIAPKMTLVVVTVAPFDGPLTVRVGNVAQIIGRKVAEHIFVKDVH